MWRPIFEPFSADLKRAVAAAPLVALLLAPIAQAQELGDRALENFGVGDNAYVRSLAIDEQSGSMWVGTSVGVLEIDLDTEDVSNVYTREHGLASEYVFAIGIEPKSRAVWFGTNAGGASRLLNGEWQTFFPMHGLADYWVYAFAFDDDNEIWIGTWEGVSLYDSETGRFTNYHDELINIWVYGVDIDPKGRVWFGTEGGVSMLDGETWRSWTHEDGLGAPNIAGLPPSANTGLGTRARHDLSISIEGNESYNPDYVFAVHCDNRDGAIWFGTWGGGVSRFDGEGVWRSYTAADGLAGNVVYSIAQDETGTLWFGTNRGISAFDGETWTTYRHGLVGSHVYALTSAGDGTIWAGTKGAVARLGVAE